MHTAELQATRMEVTRIIVLIPDQGADGIAFARRIWALAEPCALSVYFLSALRGTVANESALRLRLATLASQIRNEKVHVDTCIESELSWVSAVQRHWHPGDIVVCCAEHAAPTLTHGMQPLWQLVECSLDIPVYVLPGLYEPPAERRAPNTDHRKQTATNTWAKRLLPVFICMILFLFMAPRIDQVTAGVTHTLLLFLFAIAELGILAAMTLFT